MKIRRKIIKTLGAGALAFPLTGLSQSTGKVWRIGYLEIGSREAAIDAGRIQDILAGLNEQGLTEGKNLIFDTRFANGDLGRLEQMAKELVDLKVDLMLSVGSEASISARRATSSIPIVVIIVTDPVRDGNAISLARPGYNLTGMTNGQADTVQKLIEFLALAVPRSKRIGVMINPVNTASPPMFELLKAAMQKTGRQAILYNSRSPQEIDNNFAAMAREHIDALVLPADTYQITRRHQIGELALKYKLPLITQSLLFAEVGGLLSYGANAKDNMMRTGLFVKKILSGTKPGDIPFEQPTRYYLVINRKTANTLGIKLNNELLARADKVIE
jgi:putative ABC transport system substrate-binding protein